MFMLSLDRRLATLIRGVGLVLIVWSIVSSTHHPSGSGRGLVVAISLAAAIVAWIVWMVRPGRERPVTPELYVLAIAGGVLCGASPNGAASAFIFVAVIAAGLRSELSRAALVGGLGTLALAVSVLIYDDSALGLLAYALGFAAAALAASNSRQSVARAEQAELLLAQSQRSHEEQLRSARLEESARIARDIHDVLAHALAGLTIQLEATSALLEQGADRAAILERVRKAHALAREGLQETRRAVGALRGDSVSVAAGLRALVDEYGDAAELDVRGDAEHLHGTSGETVLRVAQEALTNVRKHAPGAAVSVAVDVGESPGEEIRLVVTDVPAADAPPPPAASELARSGGGYGLRGMRERAELLGGTLTAGPGPDGWQVELRLPVAADAVRNGATA